MCGITGFLRVGGAREDEMRACVTGMADQIVYRGPDAGAVWVEPEAGYAVGHRRLSIVDLSPAGAQPMTSASGRFVIAYNGEIYNGDDLRNELPQPEGGFRGHSDTEVLLEACAAWGVERAVQKCIGMFAFSLWDRQERRLWLARDRLGIKPLYWGVFGNLFVFGSELKAITALGGWPQDVDHHAVAAFVRYGYVPAPKSIYSGVYKLEPGTILELPYGGEPSITPFWSLSSVVRDGTANPLICSDQEATDQLELLLRDAVKRRMVADVPLGAFLSGGIDSSTVVALMQEQSSRPVKTFSIGFHEAEFNEAEHAKSVAAHLGTDHTEFYVTPQQAQEVIPSLPHMYDEPFADSSQIPTFLVSQLTRQHVTVALSGDGGDELFCGYGRYFYAANLKPHLDRLPFGIRRVMAGGIRSLSPAMWDALLRPFPSSVRTRFSGHRLHRGAASLEQDPDETYRSMLSHWHEPASLVHGGAEPYSVIGSSHARRLVPDYVARMQYVDTLTYLPDDILTKVDRASMAVSLEARVPLLDHRVVELAWRMKPNVKVRDGQGKWVLRQVLGKYVPDELIDRPKMGFGVPIGDWMRGPLRDWAEDLVSVRALLDGGLLDPAPIRQRWEAHQGGHENWQYPIWTILSLQGWLRAKSLGPSAKFKLSS